MQLCVYVVGGAGGLKQQCLLQASNQLSGRRTHGASARLGVRLWGAGSLLSFEPEASCEAEVRVGRWEVQLAGSNLVVAPGSRDCGRFWHYRYSLGT